MKKLQKKLIDAGFPDLAKELNAASNETMMHRTIADAVIKLMSKTLEKIDKKKFAKDHFKKFPKFGYNENEIYTISDDMIEGIKLDLADMYSKIMKEI